MKLNKYIVGLLRDSYQNVIDDIIKYHFFDSKRYIEEFRKYYRMVKYTYNSEHTIEISEIMPFYKKSGLSEMYKRFETEDKFTGRNGDFINFHEFILLCCDGNKSTEIFPQVSFGTGQGGVEKYGAKRFIADFVIKFSGEDSFVVEIDGKSHRSKSKIYSDRIKEKCLLELYGLETYRISNDEIEQLLMKDFLDAENKTLADIIEKNKNSGFSTVGEIFKGFNDKFSSNMFGDFTRVA